MKKTVKLLSIFLAILMTFSVISLSAFAKDKDVWVKASVSTSLSGKGTVTDPYMINSCADFMRFREMAKDSNYNNSCYKLYCDLDFSSAEEPFSPISGTFNFDGNNHIISGYSIKDDTENNVGFFGVIENCHISNLFLNVTSVSGKKSGVGSFAGFVKNCVIENCLTAGLSVSGESANVGGFVGRSTKTSFINCGAYFLLIFGKGTNVGGFAGAADTDTVAKNCVAIAPVVSGGSCVGGFAGIINDSDVTFCYTAAATVTSSTEKDPNLHGFAGRVANECTLENLTYCNTAPADSNANGIAIQNDKEYTLEDFCLDGIDGWKIEDKYNGNNLFAGLPYYIDWVYMYLPFRDIKIDSWYTNALYYCYSNKYVSGMSYDEFSPNSKLTRAQFVQILAKVAGAKLDKIEYDAKFSDVPDGKWYTKAVLWAVQNNITTGIGGGKFGPNNYVSREQLVVFLCAYARSKGIDTSDIVSLKSYTDEGNVASWAHDSFAWAVRNKIVSGTSETTLSPKNIATRAQIVVIVKAFNNYIKEATKK